MHTMRSLTFFCKEVIQFPVHHIKGKYSNHTPENALEKDIRRVTAQQLQSIFEIGSSGLHRGAISTLAVVQGC